MFGTAIGCAALLQAFVTPQNLSWLAIFSVALAMLLTNLMVVRASGLAGIGGLSLVYARMGDTQPAGRALTIITAILVVLAVFLAILADISESSKGKASQHEE
jgi:preprotein translocase subunit SecG